MDLNQGEVGRRRDDVIHTKEDLMEVLGREETDIGSITEEEWKLILQKENLSEDFLREHHSVVNWDWVCHFQTLYESLIRDFKEWVEWPEISSQKGLSESFIREFQEYVYWDRISVFQTLSESFIREFEELVDWNCISAFQCLSEDFIREFQNKVDWSEISGKQLFSDSFFDEFKTSINHFGVCVFNEKVPFSVFLKSLSKVSPKELFRYGAISLLQKRFNPTEMEEIERIIKLRMIWN